MAANEVWDLYTEDGRKTGKTIRRKDKIPAGYYHLACEVLLQHTDGDYLVMQRAATKTAYPLFWEATAGGAALAGETPETCIERECLEETGMHMTDMRVVRLPHPDKDQTLLYSYYARTNDRKDAVTLQEGETQAYKWLTPDEFARFIISDEIVDNMYERYLQFYRGNGIIKG